MGYYIRTLGLEDVLISFAELSDELAGLESKLSVQVGSADDWTELLLSHGESDIALIEKSSVLPGTIGADEIDELLEEITDARPASAACWLKEFLPKVRVTYAFQLLDLSFSSKDGSTALYRVRSHIAERTRGIGQADGEGFSNPEGYQILWQFSDRVSGLWSMAVLDEAREWKAFQTELGDKQHRKAFLDGCIPEGVKVF